MLAIIISIFSLFLSSVIAYVAYFRPAKIQMLLGNNLQLYPVPEHINGKVRWGGVGFYLPITFHNWSPTGGSIMDVRMIIERKDNPLVNYDMSWSMFGGFHDTDHRWINLGIAQPIAINGKASESKVVLFNWRCTTGENFNVNTGEYLVSVLAWTSKDKPPSLVEKISFVLTNDMVDEHKGYVKTKNPLTISIPLGENGRVNTIMSREQIKGIYKL